MGSMYAEMLYNMSPDAVKIIAGPDRIKTIDHSGITINGKPYKFSYISPDAESQSSADLIIITVKYPQLKQGVRDIRAFVGKDTIVISLLNGISSEEIIGQAIGMEHMLYAFGLGMDAVREGNVIRYANAGRIIFGELRNDPLEPHAATNPGVPAAAPRPSGFSEKVRLVKDLFERAKIPHHIPANMQKALWAKFMMNTGINQASAVLRSPYGVFQQEGEARQLMLAASDEVLTLSRHLGIGLEEADKTEFLRILDTLNPAGKTSMLQDIEAGRKSEVDLFAGTVIQLGKKYNIATPVNETLYRIIRAMEQIH
jgi:2-dehydropantoate 2-reductase